MSRAKPSKKLTMIIAAVVCFGAAGICYERIRGTAGIIVAGIFLVVGIVMLVALPGDKGVAQTR